MDGDCGDTVEELFTRCPWLDRQHLAKNDLQPCHSLCEIWGQLPYLGQAYLGIYRSTRS